MKLAIFNGSPRGKNSNTRILLKHFITGFESTPGNSHEMYDLIHREDAATAVMAYGACDAAFLAFPLYTDAMPGVVKEFIEELAPYTLRKQNPPLLFMVQSGFPEAAHGRAVEKYLQKLACRLHAPYIGTIVRGGVEGIQIQTEKMTSGLFGSMHNMGEHFGKTGTLDPTQLKALAQPEHFPAMTLWGFRFVNLFGLTNFYWDMQLKKNNAFKKRFARPYDPQD